MASEAGASGVGRRKTVLVVEDEAPVRTLIKMILEEHGFRVFESHDGQHAWSLLKDGPLNCEGVDLMVTDICMPGMDGVALTERVMLECPNVRIVLMSGYSDVDTANIESNGRWIFIAKPFGVRSLMTCIRKVGIG